MEDVIPFFDLTSDTDSGETAVTNNSPGIARKSEQNCPFIDLTFQAHGDGLCYVTLGELHDVARCVTSTISRCAQCPAPLIQSIEGRNFVYKAAVCSSCYAAHIKMRDEMGSVDITPQTID